MAYQGLLFSEPSIAETGVWCILSEGIDPAQWAGLCRFIGSLSPEQFEQVKKGIMRKPAIEKSTQIDTFTAIPLVSIGPSGLGGQYQLENIGYNNQHLAVHKRLIYKVIRY